MGIFAPDLWQEIGRVTNSGASDTIQITSFPARKYLRFKISYVSTGGTTVGTIRFNNDSGSNYANRQQANGAADATAVTQTGFLMSGAENQTPFLAEFTMLNIAASEKIGYGHVVKVVTTGAGTAPSRTEDAIKWTNTSNQITRIDITNSGAGDFAAGAQLIVEGHD